MPPFIDPNIDPNQPPIDPMTGLPMQPALPGLMPGPVGPMGPSMGMAPMGPAAPPMLGAPLPPEPFDPGLLSDEEMDDILLGQEPVRIGPRLPPGHTPPPKPEKEWVLERAGDDEAAHQLWLRMIGEFLKWLLPGGYVGGFSGDEDRVETNEVETARSNALKARHEAVCRIGAQMKTAYDLPLYDEIDAEEARDGESALTFWRRRAAEQHAARCGQSLDWAEFDIAAKWGVLIGLTKIDPQSPGGLKKRLLDPGTTFPTYGGDRLSYVTRAYTAEAAEVVGTFRDPDGKVERQILGKVNKKTGQKRKPRERIKVYEYIDEWWHCAYVDDEEIFCTAHEYNRCPVAVRFSPLGDQMVVATPSASRTRFGEITSPEDIMGAGWGSERQQERCRKALPFLLAQVESHALKEAIAGAYVTLLKRMRDPSWLHYRDEMMESQKLEGVSLLPGQVTAAGLEDRVEPVPVDIQPQVAQVVAAFVQENDALMGLPAQMQGSLAGIGTQTTGSAIDILGRNGAEQFWPIVDMVAGYRAEDARLNLYLFEAYEPIMGDWGAKGAGIVVPRQGGGPLRLTRDMINRVGTDVEVTLRDFDLSRSAQAATAAQILKVNQLAPTRDLIEALGYTTDPDAAMERIDDELFNASPEVAQLRKLKRVIDLLGRAKRRGDQESEALYFDMYTKLNELMQEQAMLKAKMAGQLPPARAPSPQQGLEEMEAGLDVGALDAGQVPPPQQGLPDVGAQGMSMPQFGRAAGTEGGRPMQAPPPGGVGV